MDFLGKALVVGKLVEELRRGIRLSKSLDQRCLQVFGKNGAWQHIRTRDSAA